MAAFPKAHREGGSAAGDAPTPPHSVEAEQAVLGGLLLDANAWDQVADVINEGDFYRPDHRLVF
ncbi:protein containing DNA helicase, DnaB-like protein, partial [mine drainage metagenome]